MNRAQRRKLSKDQQQHAKPLYSLLDVQKATVIAIEMKKASLGHLFRKELKNLCVFCGKSTKSKKECEYWFLTFMDRQQTVLINPEFFSDDDMEAIWLQHGYEYDDIKIPFHKEGNDAKA